MRPARLRKIRVKRERKSVGKKIFLLLTVLLVVGFLGKFLFLAPKFYDGKNPLLLVTFRDSGDILVSAFNPSEGEIVKVTIPGNTQVDVARQLGTFPIKNVWKLSQDEGREGSLLAQTVVKNFKFPVYIWGGAPSEGLTSGDLAGVIRGVLAPYKTSLGLFDKLRLGIFSLSVKESRRVELDAVDLGIVRSAKLPDGEAGYIVSGKTSELLTSKFVDAEIASKAYKIAVYDRSGRAKSADRVGEVAQALGGKIASIYREDKENSDCRVIGKSTRLVKILGKLFDCKVEVTSPRGNFDLEIYLGEAFVRRF